MYHTKKNQPKFEYVRRELAERIRKGLFARNDRLPPENELAELFGVSRNTIRQAIALLAKDQLLIKQQGRVSRINCVAEKPQGKKFCKLAYFSNVQPSFFNSNLVYLDIFYQLLSVAADYDLSVDFFSIDSMNCWNNFMNCRSCYLGAFSVGIRQNNVNRGIFERLNSLPDLIAIDDIEDLPGKYLVSIDNYAGGGLAARHLMQCHCRNIIMLVPNEISHPFRLRQAGFEDELKKYKHINYRIVPIDPVLLYRQSEPGDLDMIYQKIKDVDGVFCYCDMLAMRILDAASYYNRRIPEDLSLIGFDGLAICQHTQPKLTSIGQPNRAVAEAAVKLALDLFRGNRPDSAVTMIPVKLLTGETTNILSGSEKRFDIL